MRTWAVVAASICISILTVLPDAGAQELSRPRIAMTTEEVGQAIAKELRARLPKEPPSPAWDFDVPLVPAVGPHKLQVTSVCRDTNSQLLRFQLACGAPGACLPFFAYARVALPAPVSVSVCGGEAAQPAGSPNEVVVVRPGDRATAVLVVAGLRMSAPVICLDRGAQGEIIRVRGSEGHVFRARVAGSNLVEALLP